MRTEFIAGNWKMYKGVGSALAFATEFKKKHIPRENLKVAVCAPYPFLLPLVEAFRGTDITVGAQNCHFEDEGAFTGEVSVPMLKEIGVGCCIVGHSERRTMFAETDEAVNKKMKKLLSSGIFPILCIGENLKEREDGKEYEKVKAQITEDFEGIEAPDAARAVVAYEPIWAIGTGKSASAEEAEEMCAFIRGVLGDLYEKESAEKILILYGGSVKPENASKILSMPDIDGALVGGASLDAGKFSAIQNYREV